MIKIWPRSQKPLRWNKHSLRFAALAFLLAAATVLALAAVAWFFASWPARSLLAALAGQANQPAQAAGAGEWRTAPGATAPDAMALTIPTQTGAAPTGTAPPAADNPAAGENLSFWRWHVPLPGEEFGATGIPELLKRPEGLQRPWPEVPEGRLIIEALGVSEVPQKVSVQAGYWDLGKVGERIGWLETTGAHPDDALAMVFAGHVTLPFTGSAGPFYKLNQLKPGDMIYYETPEETFVFMVGEASVVAPADVQRLYRPKSGQLLLVTCTTWNIIDGRYDNRLVVEANLVVRMKNTAPARQNGL